jgi:hypothetical protein
MFNPLGNYPETTENVSHGRESPEFPETLGSSQRSLVAPVVLGFLLVCAVSADASGQFMSTGVAEIDAMRNEFCAGPTTPANAVRRQSRIFASARLLVHRGIDMSDFHRVCARFSHWGPVTPSRYGAMYEAWQALETRPC